MKRFLLPILLTLSVMPSAAQQRLVSLNGTISEMLCALGHEQEIVGVDVTSTYPEALKKKPRLGHNTNISAEGLLSLQPTLVLALDGQLTTQLKAQLKSANIKTILLKQEYSLAGTRELLQQVAAAVNAANAASKLLQQYDQQTAALHITPSGKKVLFIYARGAGSLMVSGTGTPLDNIIRLAGATNAVTDFRDFKPLSAESMVASNPDVLLLFSSGLQSIGGMDGLLKIPGVAQTTAGQKKQIISMDGEMLSGFGLRLPQAIQTLNTQITAFH